ncbi:centrosomal protein of 78 kDa isoform X2 [Ascaphus truei]|uniref:centrosomal protein of 78 kDa isoform X2 n=1 Tax=Ascaphus truei TaxID=8439 RepID=UPI003F59888C
MVLDVRRNPLIDHVLLKTVIERVLMNAHDTNPEYKWFTSPSSKDGPKARQRWRTINLRNGRKGKTATRIGFSTKKPLVAGRKSASNELYAPEPKPPGVEGFLPWRTAERANRHRGISTDWIQCSPVKTGTPVKVSVGSETSSEAEETDSALGVCNQEPAVTRSPEKISVRNYKRLQVELEDCQLRLNGERKTRLRADDRIIELEDENERLRQINQSLSEALHTQTVTSTVLEDDCVLESIEKSFHKFHAFLDLLKDAGLGQLASMAGIDQSDFALPGHPQMSSTIGTAVQPSPETHPDLHGTYFVDQAHGRDKKGYHAGLLESYALANDAFHSPRESDVFYTTNHKSKEEIGFDLDIKGKEAYWNGRMHSLQRNTKDAACVKKANLFDKEMAGSQRSASDSSRSEKSSARKKSKASLGEKDGKRSSKSSVSTGTDRVSPEAAVAQDQNSCKISLFSDASLSESEIQENLHSIGSLRSGSDDTV